MHKLTRRLVAFAVALTAFAAIAGSAAAHEFSGLTTTAGGYHTWDSDQVNIEKVGETGKGVYVAVLDTGLAPNWKDYFPEARVNTALGTGFEQAVSFKTGTDACSVTTEVGKLSQTTWVGSTGSTHGTHVASTILGYFYDAPADDSVKPLPPIVVRGIAPDVTVIPVKVLADYQMPARPKCTDPEENTAAHNIVFGTDGMVAAGIDYVTGLAKKGIKPIAINMSLGDTVPAQVIEDAVDRAIAAGVIVVASAGNNGEEGMGWPGAYPQVISAGASGWTREWLNPAATAPSVNAFYRLWWLKDDGKLGLPAGSGDVADPTAASDVYVADFSSREFAGQDLDVLAPGSWVRGPFPGTPGFRHAPWWSKGLSGIGNFFYVGGTSMAAPHVTSAAAMLLQKNPALKQGDVERILESTALSVPSRGSVSVVDLSPSLGVYEKSWDTSCDGTRCDAVGSGLLQVDAALAAAAGSTRKK
jgi:subtilisin family serine protease